MVHDDRDQDGREGSIKTSHAAKYTQDWPAYNTAQVNERDQFYRLLSELCEGVRQPVQGRGRPRLPLSDVVFSLVAKVYSTVSGRRFMSDLRAAESKGLVAKVPHYNSAFRYLDRPDVTDLLKGLIESSALPLSAVEHDFAVDSTGFTSSVYDRWFDHKWGKVRKAPRWAKAHMICGVKTNIVTGVEVTPTETADAPFLMQLVNTTAKGFTMREVSGDKAYSSRRNLHAVAAVGAEPYIPFKARTNGIGNKYDSLWHRMWSYYQYRRSEFLAHYHKRSNAETTVAMIKQKFGTRIRSKLPVAQVNEVLCKVLAHNICVLVRSIYELKLEPFLGAPKADPLPQ